MEKLNLYEFVVRTYHFGIVRYPVLVRARTLEAARKMVYDLPQYHNDEDATIESDREINMFIEGIIS